MRNKILDLELIATPSVQKGNGNLIDISAGYQPEVYRFSALTKKRGTEELTPSSLKAWKTKLEEKLADPKFQQYQEEIFKAVFKRYGLSYENVEFNGMILHETKLTYIADQANQNYRPEESDKVLELKLDILNEGFKFFKAVPWLYSVKDKVDKKNQLKKFPGSGNHRALTFEIFGVYFMLVMWITFPDEKTVSDFMIFENNKDDVKVGNSVPNVSDKIKQDIKLKIRSVANGKNWKSKLKKEVEFACQSRSSKFFAQVWKEVLCFAESYRIDNGISTATEWDFYQSKASKGHKTHEDLAKGKVITGLLAPYGGAKHFAAVQSDVTKDPQYDQLRYDDRELCVGKIINGDSSNIKGGFQSASIFVGKAIVGDKDTEDDSYGLLTPSDVLYSDKNYNLITTSCRTGEQDSIKVRMETEESAKRWESINQGEALKIIYDNRDLNVKEEIAKRVSKGMTEDNAIIDVTKMVNIYAKHVAHAPQDSSKDPTKGGKRKEDTWLDVGTLLPKDRVFD
jgi:hypothetical protein